MQVNQIAAAAEQPTTTTGEICENLRRVTEVIQGAAQGAQESASAASQLAMLAEEEQQLVGQFRLEIRSYVFICENLC